MSDMDVLSEFIAEASHRRLMRREALRVDRVKIMQTLPETFEYELEDARTLFQNFEDSWIRHDLWDRACSWAVRHAESGETYDTFFQSLAVLLLDLLEGSTAAEQEAKSILKLAKEVKP